jgi:hypothetical protein
MPKNTVPAKPSTFRRAILGAHSRRWLLPPLPSVVNLKAAMYRFPRLSLLSLCSWKTALQGPSLSAIVGVTGAFIEVA